MEPFELFSLRGSVCDSVCKVGQFSGPISLELEMWTDETLKPDWSLSGLCVGRWQVDYCRKGFFSLHQYGTSQNMYFSVNILRTFVLFVDSNIIFFSE